MDSLRSAAHLQREIGVDLFGVLVSSDNTEAVREFATGLYPLPSMMIVGGRTYEVLSFPWGDKEVMSDDQVSRWCVENRANLGEEDVRHLKRHQNEVPEVFRDKVIFLFMGWRHPHCHREAANFFWDRRCWVQHWRHFNDDRRRYQIRVLREIKSSNT